jgi:hypothetical protein
MTTTAYILKEEGIMFLQLYSSSYGSSSGTATVNISSLGFTSCTYQNVVYPNCTVSVSNNVVTISGDFSPGSTSKYLHKIYKFTIT